MHLIFAPRERDSDWFRTCLERLYALPQATLAREIDWLGLCWQHAEHERDCAECSSGSAVPVRDEIEYALSGLFGPEPWGEGEDSLSGFESFMYGHTQVFVYCALGEKAYADRRHNALEFLHAVVDLVLPLTQKEVIKQSYSLTVAECLALVGREAEDVK